MTTVEMRFDVPPERVFAVLSDAAGYAGWVVGVRSIERHDPEWPARGATLRHTEGAWPLVVGDETRVAACDPPRRLHLISKLRPLLVAHVVFELRPDDGGTRVTMDERPVGGLLELPLLLPPGSLVNRLRTLETLRRLRRRAEGP